MLIKDPSGEERWDASGYPASPSGAGRRVYYDTEGDNLLPKITQFWCVGAVDLDTAEEFYFGVDQPEGSGRTLGDGLSFLEGCALAVAHNGYDFDRRALKKIYPEHRGPAEEWDSLVLTKSIWHTDALLVPDLERIRKGLMPGHLLKRHSLKAWGYRTGTHKDEYKGGFDAWSPAMASYMMGDNAAGVAIWRLCMQRLGWEGEVRPGQLVWPRLPIEVEHAIHEIILRQKDDGVRFDTAKAIKLTSELQNSKARLETLLVELFGSWWQPQSDIAKGEVTARNTQRALAGFPDVTIPRYSAKTGKALKPYVGPPLCEYTTTAPFVKIERVTFNPSSRDHLAQKLIEKYGWKPRKYGKDGKPSVDETVLSEIPESVMPGDVRQAVLDYFVATKTLGTLSAGKKAWIALTDETGRIHGKCDPLATVTGRAAHSDPNLSGTPKVQVEKATGHPVLGLAGKYGYECRDLFIADEGWEQTGIDMASLELILMGHYLWPLDGGEFSARVCDPLRDAHAEHSEITGTSRNDAKTTIYLKIYGGSAYKLSLDPAIIVTPVMVPDLLNYAGLPMLVRSLKKRLGPEYRPLDDMGLARLARSRIIIKALDAGITGLKELQEDVTAAGEKGWLKGLDGRRIYVRKAYAAFNALLQSGGAQACKLWMMLLHQRLKELGLVHGRDYRQVLWVHDELQFTHRPGLSAVISQAAEECAVKAGEMLGLRGRFRTAAKNGRSWAECH